MSQANPQKSRKPGAHKNDLQDARPLLQAIFLGIVLATALVAAAVMANPSNAANARGQTGISATAPASQSVR